MRASESLGALYDAGVVVAKSTGKTLELAPISVPKEEAASLTQLARSEGAKSCLEIGFGFGMSGMALCAGMLQGRPDSWPTLVAIDPFQGARFLGCGLQNFEDAEISQCLEFFQTRSEWLLPQLESQGRTFDIAFVDGNHRFEWVLNDLSFLGRLVRPLGLVILDDYQLPGVRKAVAFFIANRDWEVVDTPIANEFHQWAILRLPEAPNFREFDSFVDF